MALEKQLSVFVKNTIGSLSELCDALARDGVNIHAIQTVDDIDWGIVGLITDDPEKAKKSLESNGFKFGESTVLTIELENKPGALAQTVKQLSEHNINIVHTYASAAGGHGMLVLLTTDNKRANELLSK